PESTVGEPLPLRLAGCEVRQGTGERQGLHDGTGRGCGGTGGRRPGGPGTGRRAQRRRGLLDGISSKRRGVNWPLSRTICERSFPVLLRCSKKPKKTSLPTWPFRLSTGDSCTPPTRWNG